jgi:hypothetical protein
MYFCIFRLISYSSIPVQSMLHNKPDPRCLLGYVAATERRLATSVFVFLLTVFFFAVSAQAADQPAATANPAGPAGTPTAMVALVNRLVERGALTKEDSAEMLLLAEADAADARAQVALTQAALAQAAAAEARARAYAAMLRAAQAKLAAGETAPAANVVSQAPSPGPATVPQVQSPAPPAVVAAAPAAAGKVFTPSPIASSASSNSPEGSSSGVGRALLSPGDGRRPRTTDSAAAAESVPDDTVRVTYVPEVVKQELRQEVKQDVLDEARKEGWATPQAVPGWVSKFRLFGDLRTRYEALLYPAGNDDTGAFPNFNAINTGAPFDTAGTIFSPQLNVNQDRQRERLRVRLGAEIDLGQNFSAGVRVATGQNGSPVTENQTLGAVGTSGQGGDFSNYALWLDRGFMKYELGGMPDKDLSFTLGRFDNPFFATSMIWANDLGFDGAVVQGKFPVGEDVTPFFAMGAFPVFDTDLNFATNQPSKFKSQDKWLYAAQLGTTLDLGKDFGLKVGAAYYLFQNISGKLSDPFTPFTTSDAGNTDSTRPAFAQTGNTYMALRDIVPGPLNNNGTIDQFQYFGLASKFHELALDTKLDFNQFEPFQISLEGEYVKNLGFDRPSIAAIAVNNLGTATSGTGPVLGSNTAWLVRLTMGDAVLQKLWDWNANIGYRRVGSDSVVDGFCDADFGGGGTNFKGLTAGANLAFTPDVWLGVRWFSATQAAGPTFKNDIIQVDLNSKF